MSTKKLLALSDSRNVITTIIGGGKAPFKDRGLAQEAILEGPSAVAVDEEDNIYIAGFLANRVFKIDTKGRISAFAGTGEKITSGDGGPAVDAGLNGPSAIAVDGGLVYIAEQLSDRIRVVDTNGVINTFAGNGRGGLVVDGKREPIKDGVHATKAPLEQPAGLAIRDGELYFTEFAGNRVRKVNKDGTLSTVAGTGERTSAGDGGPATEASLQGPTGILVDHRGRVYVSEVFSARIRRIDEKGRITTVAGLGKSGQPADGDRARGARLRWPHGLALDEEDNLYVADFAANRVYAIGRDGLINTIAGTGKGGPLKAGRATTGPIENPLGLAIDSSGGLLITLFNQGSLVRIDPKGRVEHLVGQPSKRRATQASPGEAYLKGVGGVTSDVKGNIYVAEVFGNTVHRVTPSARMTTFTGSGFARSSGDSNGASDAEVNHPVGLWPHNGGLFVAEADGHRIRFIDEDGVITTIAGTGEPGFLGDGGRGADALMAHPHGLLTFGAEVSNPAPFIGRSAGAKKRRGSKSRFPLAEGSFLVFVDTDNHRVRRIDSEGKITTIAGNGKPVSSGDNGKAKRAGLNRPEYLAIDSEGNIYVSEAHKVRKIDTKGIITTVAGTGKRGFSGANGPATRANLDSPYGLALDGKDLYIADSWNNVVWKVDAKGIITLFAGTGKKSSTGDNGPAAEATFNAPIDLAIHETEEGVFLLIGELEGARVRAVRIR